MNDDLLSAAREFGASTLFEAARLRCALDRDIRPIRPGIALAGPAYPLSCAPDDNLAIHLALEAAPRGSVLVVEVGGFVAGYWGEVLTVSAQARGIAGLVMDGGVRDVAAMNRRGFPVFSRGISVRGTSKTRMNSFGETICIGDCTIAPGDLVMGDDDGVVVIPAGEVERVIAAGRARTDKEADMMLQLAGTTTTVDLLGLQAWRKAQR